MLGQSRELEEYDDVGGERMNLWQYLITDPVWICDIFLTVELWTLKRLIPRVAPSRALGIHLGSFGSFWVYFGAVLRAMAVIWQKLTVDCGVDKASLIFPWRGAAGIEVVKMRFHLSVDIPRNVWLPAPSHPLSLDPSQNSVEMGSYRLCIFFL